MGHHTVSERPDSICPPVDHPVSAEIVDFRVTDWSLVADHPDAWALHSTDEDEWFEARKQLGALARARAAGRAR